MESRKYDLIITSHARLRYVERVVDRKRYYHLGACRLDYCPTCQSLIHDLNGAIQVAGRNIDTQIVRRFREARARNEQVTDVSFKLAMAKEWGEDVKYLTFYIDYSAVLMVLQRPEQETPVLLTVMSHDMIDGTVIRKFNKEEMADTFKRWKFQTKFKDTQ